MGKASAHGEVEKRQKNCVLNVTDHFRGVTEMIAKGRCTMSVAGEICGRIREARDKNRAIGIMSQVYCLPRETIMGYLLEYGLIDKNGKWKAPARMTGKEKKKTGTTRERSEGMGMPRNKHFTWTQERLEELQRYLGEGLSNIEIAERMGCDSNQVSCAKTVRLKGSGMHRGTIAGPLQPDMSPQELLQMVAEADPPNLVQILNDAAKTVLGGVGGLALEVEPVISTAEPEERKEKMLPTQRPAPAQALYKNEIAGVIHTIAAGALETIYDFMADESIAKPGEIMFALGGANMALEAIEKLTRRENQ